jgi:hypothetical protein
MFIEKMSASSGNHLRPRGVAGNLVGILTGGEVLKSGGELHIVAKFAATGEILGGGDAHR